MKFRFARQVKMKTYITLRYCQNCATMKFIHNTLLSLYPKIELRFFPLCHKFAFKSFLNILPKNCATIFISTRKTKFWVITISLFKLLIHCLLIKSFFIRGSSLEWRYTSHHLNNSFKENVKHHVNRRLDHKRSCCWKKIRFTLILEIHFKTLYIWHII